MGQQPYSALPQFLAAWDVCLMPFAMNESTRFISPTKSLEYMAAELPIVSTPVKDVLDLHSDVVEIATEPSEFIAACERVLNMPSDAMLRKIRMMRDKLSRTSWNATAEKMHALLEQLDGGEMTELSELSMAASSDSTSSRTNRMAGARE
jgi:glycosyltransferase involved in cell wall biosynthesis